MKEYNCEMERKNISWKEKTSAMNLCFPSVLKTKYPGTAEHLAEGLQGKMG